MPCLTNLTLFASSSKVNIEQPAFSFTIRYLDAVPWHVLPSLQILTTMWDSKSFTTSFLEDKISSKNECVFIHNLSDLTLQIIFDAWWASINVGSEQSIGCNNYWNAATWGFYLHCGIEETSSLGMICIVCHQVLCHSSEHMTSSMAKQMLAKAHIAKLNKLTESDVNKLTSSMVNTTALAILEIPGSGRIPIVSSHKKFIFDSQVWSILTELTDTMHQTGG